MSESLKGNEEIIVMDKAGWHKSKKPEVQSNIEDIAKSVEL
ncbi:hypothetical protein [Holospora obtusa]|nr:hypothetical protein [Holospora obtusa]